MEKYIVNKETLVITYLEDNEIIWEHQEKNMEELEATIKHLKDFNGSNHELEIIEKIEIIEEFKSIVQFNKFFKNKEVKVIKASVFEDQDGSYIEIFAELDNNDDINFETILYSKGGDTKTLLKKLKKISKKYKKWVAESYVIDCEFIMNNEVVYV